MYALGGGGGFHGRDKNYGISPQTAAQGANGAGAGHGSTSDGGTGGTLVGYPGTTQTSETGLGIKGSPTYTGGYTGGALTGSWTPNHGGAGSAGAGGNGGDRDAGGSGGVGGVPVPAAVPTTPLIVASVIGLVAVEITFWVRSANTTPLAVISGGAGATVTVFIAP